MLQSTKIRRYVTKYVLNTAIECKTKSTVVLRCSDNRRFMNCSIQSTDLCVSLSKSILFSFPYLFLS